jgi:hypothetical protein
MLAAGRYAEFVAGAVRLRDSEGQMKKSALVSLLVLAVLLLAAAPSHAWRHFHHGGVFISRPVIPVSAVSVRLVPASVLRAADGVIQNLR